MTVSLLPMPKTEGTADFHKTVLTKTGTLPESNVAPEIDGWKTIVSFLGCPLRFRRFRRFREGKGIANKHRNTAFSPNVKL